MSEPHPDGWRRHDREPAGKRDPDERVEDSDEIYEPDWDPEHLRDQGERCMDCSTPTCMGGCPIGNVIPDWNDLVHRDDWREALRRLHATNNFPEFTGYTCPAPCEDACVLAFNDEAVTIKSIERAIVDRGWEEGWITPEPPETRTGHEVVVVGSGPAGLAAAQQLNRAGHRVTVLERDEEPGGMMRYGIPEFKIAAERVQRRIDQLEAEGVTFRTGIEVGEGYPASRLLDHDAACLAVGSRRERSLDLPGAGLDGVHQALDFLTQENRRQEGQPVEDGIDAAGKDVVVLGGGDTGADCVGTAHRQGAEQVVQIELFPKPPEERPADNPWPAAPQTYEKTYAQKEGGREEFQVETQALVDRTGDGRVDALRADRVEWTLEDGAPVDKTVLEEGLEFPADLVLLAVGFEGPEAGPFQDLGVETAPDGTILTDERKMTSVEGVFAAGDANRGPSLVVWAIGEGRDAARHVDAYLTGDSDLPPSLETPNPPLVT